MPSAWGISVWRRRRVRCWTMKPQVGSGRGIIPIGLRRCLSRKCFCTWSAANGRFCRWHWSGLIACAAIRGGLDSYQMPGVIWRACAPCWIGAIPTSADHSAELFCTMWRLTGARSEDRTGPATMLLDAGAKLDARDDLLKSTPLGWACRWGCVELVKQYLSRGADAIEADAEPWARPGAWAEKMKRRRGARGAA